MTWSYSEDDLGTDDAVGRLNTVRLLIGDTDNTDQLIQDEEITFSLTQAANNVYYAASWCAGAIAAKFSRKVTTELDGQLRADYSDLASQYHKLSSSLRQDGAKYGSGSLGIDFGGTTKSGIDAVRSNDDRVKAAFTKDKWRFRPRTDNYDTDYRD